MQYMNLFFLVLLGSGCVHGNDGQNQPNSGKSRSEPIPAASAPAAMADSSHLRVFLRDGSQLVGTADRPGFPLQTFYGTLDLPFGKIRVVTFSDSLAECTVEFSNGDVLHGKVGLNSFGFDGVLGRLDLPVQSLVKIIPVGRAGAIGEGIVAYYPLDGSVADASGHGHDGVNHGATPSPDRFGNAQHAYSFNGSGAYVALPDGLIDPNVQGFTMSAWVLARSMGGERFCVYIGANSGEASLTAKDQQFRFITSLGNHGGIMVTAPADLNKFVHVACVYKRGRSISLWINGRQSGETSIPDDALVHRGTDHSSTFGSYAPEQPNHSQTYHLWTWDGIIDDVRIYNRALEPEEILALSSE